MTDSTPVSMTDSASDSTEAHDERTDEGRETPELETLARDEEWGDEAFRDAGEATFRSD
jgi:hypothetical protein